MKTVTMTLNKANKCVEKIKHELGTSKSTSKSTSMYDRMNGSSDKHTAVIGVQLSTSYTIDAMRKELEKKSLKTLEATSNYLNLVTDLNNLKTSIFKTNVQSELNSVLSEIELTKLKLNVYKALKSSLDTTHFTQAEVTNDILEQEKKVALSGESPSKYFAISMSIYNVDEISQMVKALTTRQNELEDKKVAANANAKISVELSDYTAEILGIV